MTTLESILKKAINRSLKEFTGENSVSSLEEFLQSPLNAPNSPSVDTFALKNEVLESSRVYERVKAAIDDSTGTLGEDSECVVEVREVISTLQAILDDYEAEMDRTTAVSDLFDLRQRVMDYFDRALRLQVCPIRLVFFFAQLLMWATCFKTCRTYNERMRRKTAATSISAMSDTSAA